MRSASAPRQAPANTAQGSRKHHPRSYDGGPSKPPHLPRLIPNASLYSRRSARRSFVHTVAFRSISQLATILGYVVLVRGMPAQQFGVYSLMYAFIPVIGTLLSLGMEQVLQRYQPEYLRSGNRAAAAWLVRVIAWARLGANLLIISAVLLSWNLIAPLFKLTPYRSLFPIFSILILFSFQSRILQLALASHMMHRFSVGSTSALAIIKLVAYSVLYQTHRLTLEAAIYADIIGYGCAYVVLRIMYNRHCLAGVSASSYKPDAAEKRRLMRYAAYNNFNDAGVLLLYSTVDNFFIAAYLDTLSVGIYSFYNRLRAMVLSSLPVKLFENIIQPMFFSIPSQQALAKVPRFFSLLLNLNLLLVWPALAFSIAFHAEIVQVVFHGKFLEHSLLLPLVMSFAAINVLADPVSLVAQHQEQAHVLLWSKLFAIYNVAAMFLLVPSLGVYGAALAAGTAQTMKNLFIWWRVRQHAVWLNARASLLSCAVIWGGAIGVCLALKWLVPASPLVRILMGAAVFGVALLIYVRSPALSTSDRDLLSAVVPDRLAPWMRKLGVLAR